MNTTLAPSNYDITVIRESDPAVQAELHRMLAVRSLMSARTSAVGYGFQTFLLWQVVALPWLLSWLLGMVVVEFATGSVASRALQAADDPVDQRRWLRLLPFNHFASGGLWGCVVLLPGVQADTTLLLLNLLCLAVIANVSVHNLCFNRLNLLAFVGGMALPYGCVSAATQTGTFGLMWLGALALVGMVMLYGRVTRKLYVRDIRGRLTTEDLASQVHARNEELHQAMAHIRHLASVDPLTHCLNRRAMMLELEDQRTGFYNHGTNFGVIMFDLDHFKSVNDRLGHAAGDAVLVSAAQRLRAALRANDKLARWGGEEFLCLVTQVNPDALAAKADDLRRLLASTPLVNQPEPLTVTASIGVAHYRGGQTLDELIDLADRAQYRAKTGGRDRVCVAEGPAADADLVISRAISGRASLR